MRRYLLALGLAFAAITASNAQLVVVKTLTGSGGRIDSTGTLAQLDNPFQLQLDTASKRLYWAEAGGQLVRYGDLSTYKTRIVAGAGYDINFPTDGIGNKAIFNFPHAFVPSKTFRDSLAYTNEFAQGSNNNSRGAVRRINLRTGQTTILAGLGAGTSGSGNQVQVTAGSGLAVAGGSADTIYFASNNGGISVLIPGNDRASTLVTTLVSAGSTGDPNAVNAPRSIALDGRYLIVADNGNNRILRIDRYNSSITIIGTGFNQPYSLSKESDTTWFVGEVGGNRISRLNTRTGVRTTLTSPGVPVYGVAYWPGTDTLFFTEAANNRVRAFSLRTNTSSTVFGSTGFIVDGDPKLARFKSPVALDFIDTNLVVLDRENRAIRLVDTASGRVSSYTGVGGLGYVRFSSIASSRDKFYTTEDERAAEYRVREVDFATKRVRNIVGRSFQGPQGTNVAGDSNVSNARQPRAVVINKSKDKIYFGGSSVTGNELSNSVRVVDLNIAVLSHLAGDPNTSGFADGTFATAIFNNPVGLTILGDTVIYVTDAGNYRIRKLDLRTQTVTTIAGNGSRNFRDNAVGTAAQFEAPGHLTVSPDHKYLYVGDNGNRLRRISLFGTFEVKTVAGGTVGFADGLGSAAQFNGFGQMRFDSAGRFLYIPDVNNNRIRKINFITNTAPSFVAGPDTVVNENAPAQILEWASNITRGTDPIEETQTVTFTAINDNPTLFAQQPRVDSIGRLRFRPATNAFGVANVRVFMKDNGGIDGGGIDSTRSVTFRITIRPVNNAPVYTLPTANQTVTVTQQSGAQSIANFVTQVAASNAPNNEASQTLNFTLVTAKPQLYTVAPRIVITGNAPTFFGRLEFTPNPANTGVDTVSIVLKDDGGLANGGVDSTVGTFIIRVDPFVNKAPLITISTANLALTYPSTNNVNPIAVNAWATAISPGAGEASQTLTLTIRTTKPQLYAVLPTAVLAPSGPSFVANLSFRLSGLAGLDTLTAVLKDDGGLANGGVDSVVRTFTIRINAVLNMAPNFTLSMANSFIRINQSNTAPFVVNNWATAVNPGNASEASQALSFTIKSKYPTLYTAVPTASVAGTGTNRTASLSFQINGALGIDTLAAVLKDNGGTLNGGTDSTVQTFYIEIGVGGVTIRQLINAKVYPVPAKDVLNVEGEGNCIVKMYDAKGTVVLERSFSEAEVINLSGLKAGMYRWLITNDKGYRSGNVVKE